MQITLAQPRSFCAGVVRAIDIVKTTLEFYRPPIYVLHEIVHNRRVVESLEAEGAIFTETLAEIPDGAVVIFSAHGVSNARFSEAQRKNLQIIDATCPLVSKVHREVATHARHHREVILIGHPNHVEVIGTLGRYEQSQGGGIYVVQNIEEAQSIQVKNPEQVGYVTQTTLSINDTQKIIEVLQKRFPKLIAPAKGDICYATQNRQQGILEMIPNIDLLLIVGAKNSSNCNRLKEIGVEHGIPSYLIPGVADIQKEWFQNNPRIGLSAGASTPELVVQEVLNTLKKMGVQKMHELPAEPEQVTFTLPSPLKELLEKSKSF